MSAITLTTLDVVLIVVVLVLLFLLFGGRAPLPAPLVPERACNGCARPTTGARFCERCAPVGRLRGREGVASRRAAKARAGWRCERCGSTTGLVVDHRVRLRDGGTNDPRNLQVLCGECHLTKTRAEVHPRAAPW
jgi:5-methylcytosine-specific restriction endonuclease McrA